MNARPRFVLALLLAFIFAGAYSHSAQASRICIGPPDFLDCYPKNPSPKVPPIGADLSGTLHCLFNEATGQQKCVESLEPGENRDTPDGWGGPDSPPGHVPSTKLCNYLGGQAVCSSAAGQAHCEAAHTSYPVTYTGPPSYQCRRTSDNQLVSGIGTSNGCPSGYTYNGTQQRCNLNDAEDVEKPSDGKCQFKREGNSFSDDPQDPDCADSSGQNGAPGWSSSGGEFTSSSPNGTMTHGANSDGTGYVEHKEYNYDQNVTNITNVQTSAPVGASNPQVTGSSSATSIGTGTGESSTPNEQVSIDMPTDYARQNTLESLRADVADGIKLDEEGTPETAPDGAFDAAETVLDEQADGLGDALSIDPVELPDLLPGGGGCQTISGDIFGHSFNVPGSDGCDRLEALKDILSWAVSLSTVFYIFWLAVRRPA